MLIYLPQGDLKCSMPLYPLKIFLYPETSAVWFPKFQTHQIEFLILCLNFLFILKRELQEVCSYFKVCNWCMKIISICYETFYTFS